MRTTGPSPARPRLPPFARTRALGGPGCSPGNQATLSQHIHIIASRLRTAKMHRNRYAQTITSLRRVLWMPVGNATLTLKYTHHNQMCHKCTRGPSHRPVFAMAAVVGPGTHNLGFASNHMPRLEDRAMPGQPEQPVIDKWASIWDAWVDLFGVA